MKNEKFSLKKRLLSFKYAFNGFLILFKEEHNSRIHFLATIITITLGFVLGISETEWFVIIILIGFVFAMELFNSAIENLCDLVSREKNEYIKKAKDQAAAAVLIASLVAFIIGLWIFIPKISKFIS